MCATRVPTVGPGTGLEATHVSCGSGHTAAVFGTLSCGLGTAMWGPMCGGCQRRRVVARLLVVHVALAHLSPLATSLWSLSFELTPRYYSLPPPPHHYFLTHPIPESTSTGLKEVYTWGSCALGQCGVPRSVYARPSSPSGPSGLNMPAPIAPGAVRQSHVPCVCTHANVCVLSTGLFPRHSQDQHSIRTPLIYAHTPPPPPHDASHLSSKGTPRTPTVMNKGSGQTPSAFSTHIPPLAMLFTLAATRGLSCPVLLRGLAARLGHGVGGLC